MVQLGQPDERWDCDGMLSLLAERARQNGRWQDKHSRIFGVNFDVLWTPFGGNVSYRPISSNDESRLHQIGTTGAAWDIHGLGLACVRRMVR